MLTDIEKRTLDTVRKLIRRNAKSTLDKLLQKLHPADLALIITNLSDIDRKKIWDHITDHSKIAEIILEMQENDIVAIFEELDSKEAAMLISEMDSDDALYIIKMIPKEKQMSILKLIPKESLAEVEELLQYPEDSAGAIMNTSAFTIHKNTTVKEATKMLHKAEDIDTVVYLYIIDDDEHLVGIVSLRQLILNAPEKLLSEIMETNMKTIKVLDTKEEAAALISKYDFSVLPVVDEQFKICGIVTFDDVIDIIQDKAKDDIYAMAGMKQTDSMFESPFKAVKARIPWILVTFVIEILAGAIITYFSGKDIKDFAILVSFMPTIMAMGGNVGTQASTIIIQGVALGKIDISKWWGIILKELGIAALMAAIIGIMLEIVSPLFGISYTLGFIVAVAIFAAMLFASLIGSGVPIALFKLKFDPAVASAPLIMAFNDIAGITIYFAISMGLLMLI